MKLCDVLSTLLNSTLNESKSADLYHGTHIEAAEQILATNMLTARAPIEATARKFMRKDTGGENATVSMSRSLSAARSFASGSSRKTGISAVVFVIDQDLLSRDIGKRLTPYNDLYASNPTPGNRRNISTEYEEAVMGDIKNITKYIKQILVYVDSQRVDLIDSDKFPHILQDSRTEFISNSGIKDTASVYDRFPTAREISKQPKLSIPGIK